MTLAFGSPISLFMSLRPILIAPDPRLKQKSLPVEAVDDELRALMDDMLETMYAAPGIGLAAIQVGIPKRVIVLDIAKEDEEPSPLFLVNPEITWHSDMDRIHEEGCLSLPEYYEEVQRPHEVKIAYLDYAGEEQEMHCEEMMAVCVQHEIDHLEGVLFVDHLTRLKRQIILKKLKKSKKQLATT